MLSHQILQPLLSDLGREAAISILNIVKIQVMSREFINNLKFKGNDGAKLEVWDFGCKQIMASLYP